MNGMLLQRYLAIKKLAFASQKRYIKMKRTLISNTLKVNNYGNDKYAHQAGA